MENYTIEGYKIYEAPKNPTENGTYIGKTPILEQAETAVNNAKEQGKVYFIKAVCSDGIERYYN